METSINNKCKAFTSLEQSKKLAEILPLESADMFCADVFDKEKETHSYNFHILSTWGCNKFEELKDRENKFVRFVPVWSLAALLEIIKKLVGYSLQSLDTHTVFMNCELGDKPYNIETENYDNPVDACVAMIEKLNELNLL